MFVSNLKNKIMKKIILSIFILGGMLLTSCQKDEVVVPPLTCQQTYDQAIQIYNLAYQSHQISKNQWEQYCNDAKDDYDKCILGE